MEVFMERISKNEVTAILALIGLSSGGLLGAQLSASAKDLRSTSPLYVAEKAAPAGKGKDSACGKGSCGTDTKGAAAAKKAHAGKSKGKTASQAKKSSQSSAATSDKSTSAK
jgi:hypothetical protein